MEEWSADHFAESVAQQKQRASLEADRAMLEAFAARRTELKEAIQQALSCENECWMASGSKASFFLVPKEPAAELLQRELDALEEEIRRLCGSIQSAMESS